MRILAVSIFSLLLALGKSVGQPSMLELPKPHFVYPKGFEVVNAKQAAELLGTETLPMITTVSETGETVITYDSEYHPDKGLKLEKLKSVLPGLLKEQSPNINWLAYDYTKFDGDTWIYGEFNSSNPEDNRYNIIMQTVKNDMLFNVNVASTREEFARIGEEIRACLAETTLKVQAINLQPSFEESSQ
ncbi:hypothetical protein [Pelagicoccus albus]|uniref:Uncharacterized protein n=1 Tax=Pelagicoccus albus TaxID=415222 RepID=A0A7X1B6Z2_9BACT|nr:hypothetical protein [Pelagicoccus albus]MBC2605533.1 hypothetical protein [Pelagicoccus albus]